MPKTHLQDLGICGQLLPILNRKHFAVFGYTYLPERQCLNLAQ